MNFNLLFWLYDETIQSSALDKLHKTVVALNDKIATYTSINIPVNLYEVMNLLNKTEIKNLSNSLKNDCTSFEPIHLIISTLLANNLKQSENNLNLIAAHSEIKNDENILKAIEILEIEVITNGLINKILYGDTEQISKKLSILSTMLIHLKYNYSLGAGIGLDLLIRTSQLSLCKEFLYIWVSRYNTKDYIYRFLIKPTKCEKNDEKARIKVFF